MNRAPLNHQRMQGLSLVETMVAITISLILMAGAITLFINNKVTYQVNDNLSRLQENARFAVDFMIKDLRMAGYFGCTGANLANSFATGAAGDTASLGATDNPIEGFDDVAGAWSPSGDGDNTQILAGTDAFTVRHLAGENATVIASGINLLTLELDAGADFAAGDQVGVSDCGGTDIFEIATLNGDTITGTLSREYDTDGNADDPGNPQVASFVAIRYFISVDPAPDDGPALYREVIRNGVSLGRERLIEGVENMHIVYGVDNDGDRVPDVYVPADDPALDSQNEWGSVMAVRIAMLVRTLEQYGQDVDSNTYQLNDFTVPAAGDRFKRRLFNTTVLLRNRLT